MSTFINRKKAHPFGYALNSTCARRFELPTFWSVARRSIQLSYAHITVFRFSCVPHSKIYYSVGPHGCQQVFLTFFKLFSNFFTENFPLFFLSITFATIVIANAHPIATLIATANAGYNTCNNSHLIKTGNLLSCNYTNNDWN